MPVSPATVPETFVGPEPVAHDRPVPATDDGGDASSRTPLTRRLLLAGACVGAFVVGFAGVTVLMSDESASKPRAKTTPTSAVPAPAGVQAPAPSSRAATPTSAAPPGMLVDGQAGAVPSTTPPPAPAPMPLAENAAPAPSTSSPPTTTVPPTTTPPTTTP